MIEFFRLIRNENMKIYGRTRTVVLLGLLSVSVFILALFQKFVENQTGIPVDLWDFAWQASDLLILVKFLAILIAGDTISGEFTWGTVKLLLIRPVSRAKILWSKYLAALLFAIVGMLALLLNSLLFGAVFFKITGLTEKSDLLKQIGLTYGLETIEVIMLVSLAFTLSAATRSSSMAIAASMFLLFAGSFLVELFRVSGFSLGKYLLFANTDWTQYVNHAPLFPGMTPLFSFQVLLFHWILFHVVAWFCFVKRDVTV